jgi:hypothetical protein
MRKLQVYMVRHPVGGADWHVGLQIHAGGAEQTT